MYPYVDGCNIKNNEQYTLINNKVVYKPPNMCSGG